MPPSPEAEIFTKIIAYLEQTNDSRFVLKPSLRLQEAIESRWQTILGAKPAIADASDVFKILVQDIFNELGDNSSELFLAHWQSLLYGSALKVSSDIFKIVKMQNQQNTVLPDIQSICIGSVGNPNHFFRGFDLTSSQQRNLLVSLQAYAYRAIKYSAYPTIRKEFSDPNIGRSNLSLFNHYSDVVITDALLKTGLEPVRQEASLILCRCAREYLRQNSKNINQLETVDFNHIGDLYKRMTGNLPPPVQNRLEEIGGAIRIATSPRILSIDQPISSSDDSTWTIADSIATLEPPPDEYAEIQELQLDWKKICNHYLEFQIQPRDQQILYLRYYFHLKQDMTGRILNIDQTNIARRLRKIHLGIAEALIKQINPQANISSIAICKPVIAMFQESFEKLSMANINAEDRSNLERLVQAYRGQAGSDLAKEIQEVLKRLWN